MTRDGTPLLIGDEEVRARLDAGTAVAAVRRALLAHHRKELAAPARLAAPVGDRDLVFTAGAEASAARHGFRAYDTRGGEQLVAVWDSASGALLAVVHGRELGPRRTGAIGAVAVDALARPDAARLGVIGAGTQAYAQLWALAAVRRPAEVAVFARRPERVRAFVARVSAELGIPAVAAPTAEAAVRDRDVVITATSSRSPVLEADWIAPGTLISTLGTKMRTGSELPPELIARADVVVTDSRAQTAAYGPDHLIDPAAAVELGAVLAGEAPGRAAAGRITLFSSVGLAGTEVAVAAELAAVRP
ncbi:ornithine cyclodeaminase [Streptomyces sp. Ru73]|uniref:ornithine cyclodeaminase family protein n=1 Tax=Streptomyces sp. Ru73 TaxID=2080748 RepID=UPI000CDD7B7E|nr:NAD(P)-binding domain-containing protein [Streptomyces sp. Ru73]POX38956.1 ornithine cyclodeaminase [Streptomyces sp. Ru73]